MKIQIATSPTTRIAVEGKVSVVNITTLALPDHSKGENVLWGRAVPPGTRGHGAAFHRLTGEETWLASPVLYGTTMDVGEDAILSSLEEGKITFTPQVSAFLSKEDLPVYPEEVTFEQWGLKLPVPELRDTGSTTTVSVIGKSKPSSKIGEVEDNPGLPRVPEVSPFYVPAKMSGMPHTLHEVLEMAYESRKPEYREEGIDPWTVIISGETGSGKSHGTQQFAASKGIGYAQVQVTPSLEPRIDAWATTLLTDQGITWRFTAAGMAVKYGGIVELLEFNSGDVKASMEFASAFDRFVTLPNGEVMPVHPDCMFVLTVNPVDSEHLHSDDMTIAVERRVLPVQMESNQQDVLDALVPNTAAQTLFSLIRDNKEINRPLPLAKMKQLHDTVRVSGSLWMFKSGLVNFFKEEPERQAVSVLFDSQAPTLAVEYGVEDPTLSGDSGTFSAF